MSFTIATGISGGGARIPCGTSTPYTSLPHRPLHLTSPPSSSSTNRDRTLHVVSATKKFSPRSGRSADKSRRGSTITARDKDQQPTAGIENSSTEADDGYVLPLGLPGGEPDFWEGPQWDGLGFFIQYMWAFSLPFAIIACGIAVLTYNDGATDFKETPAYKESVQSSELLEGPEASDSDVFESNPTEVAPSLQ